jgi:hypothetical protein
MTKEFPSSKLECAQEAGLVIGAFFSHYGLELGAFARELVIPVSTRLL